MNNTLPIVGLAGFGGFWYINNWSTPILGIPLTVFAVATAGALFSNAHAPKIESKKKLYFLTSSNIFISSMMVAIAPGAFGWDWVKTEVQAPLAGVLAFVSQWAIPTGIELIPELTRKFFRLGNKNET